MLQQVPSNTAIFLVNFANLPFAARRWTPLIQSGFTQPESSEPGLLLEWFAEDPDLSPDAKCVLSDTTTCTSMYFSQMIFPTVPQTHFIRVRATYKAENSCKYRFGLSVCGRARMTINGQEVVDLWTSKPEKTDETPIFNKFTMERFVDMELEKGSSYDFAIVMTNKKDDTVVGDPGLGGVRLGGHQLLDEEQAIQDAVALAMDVDIPIVMAGLSADWEYEGADRSDLQLPRRQNELVQRVVEANPNTVSRHPLPILDVRAYHILDCSDPSRPAI
jgi:beta-glucosidase